MNNTEEKNIKTWLGSRGEKPWIRITGWTVTALLVASPFVNSFQTSVLSKKLETQANEVMMQIAGVVPSLQENGALGLEENEIAILTGAGFKWTPDSVTWPLNNPEVIEKIDAAIDDGCLSSGNSRVTIKGWELYVGS